jgi:protein transport protein SEC31
MVRLREIPRTATFAWSPGPTQPLIATGTKAGAVDADFSNDTQLELWELKLDDAEQGVELQPVATVSVDSRYDFAAQSRAWGFNITPDSTILHGVSPARTTRGV